MDTHSIFVSIILTVIVALILWKTLMSKTDSYSIKYKQFYILFALAIIGGTVLGILAESSSISRIGNISKFRIKDILSEDSIAVKDSVYMIIETEHVHPLSAHSSYKSSHSTKPKKRIRHKKAKKKPLTELEKRNLAWKKAGLRIGHAVTYIPDSMQYDKTILCVLRLEAGAKTQAELFKDIANGTTDSSEVTTKEIPTSTHMEAHLEDPDDAFVIVLKVGLLRQRVDDNSLSEWRWSVTPKKPGNHQLLATVDMLNGEEGKSQTVARRDVWVNSTYYDIVWRWMRENDDKIIWGIIGAGAAVIGKMLENWYTNRKKSTQ